MHQSRRIQERVLLQVLRRNAAGEFGRRHDFAAIRDSADFARAVPLSRYEDLRPYIERLLEGDVGALLNPRERIEMFATSSGTTAAPKYIPVTPRFVSDYRRGWNTFGSKMLSDHPEAILRAILQSSGRHDESRAPSGVPCGAITGLLARTQKRIVRRFYVGTPEIAQIDDARARYYALMRFGVARDVAFGVTANPATFIRLARTADEESERLIRDVRDGTLCSDLVTDTPLRRRLEAALRPDAQTAERLARLRQTHGALRPRDFWKLEFLACWTGGSMGRYLAQLKSLYGELPVRDIGLLASEGRVTIPLDDNVPVGVLDVTAGFFEFIPVDQFDEDNPQTMRAWEVTDGSEYAVVLTNFSGLVRYRLDDVVRVRGWMDQAPLLEFLYRGGRVASLAGEKLTENQVVAAVAHAGRACGVDLTDFVIAPCWSDPPFYRLSCERPIPESFAELLDQALSAENGEYASRRKSQRLARPTTRSLPPGTFFLMDGHAMNGATVRPEQYKRQCLFTQPGQDDVALGL